MLKALTNLASNRLGAASILNAGLLNVFVEKISDKVTSKQLLVLETLYLLVRFGTEPFIPQTALNLNLIERLMSLIQNPEQDQTERKVKAVKVLMALW